MASTRTNFRTKVQSQRRKSSSGIGQSRSYESEGETSVQSKSRRVFELIEAEKWNDLIEHIQETPESAKCRHRIPNSVQCNLPLHEVCRRQAPLYVVNFLLDMYDEAVLTPGQFGFLPLHIACGSGASYEVVARLLDAYPAAARCRDDTKDSLPLHLAAQWGASEEVLMEILTTHPEGSFLKNRSGKTPMDLALELPDGDDKEIAVAALGTAPILVATARAAARKVEQEMESRLRGMQDAHNEFIRQMESRHEDEKTEFLQLEVQFHNELAIEKERNCELAELILNQRKSEFKDSDERKMHIKRLDVQRREYQERWERHKNGLKAVLDGNDIDEDGMPHGEKSLDGVDGSFSDEELERVALLARQHKRTKEELTRLSGELFDRDDLIMSLQESVEKKKREAKSLTAKLTKTESERQEFEERVRKMAAIHRGTLQELNSAKNEMNRLSRRCDSQMQQLDECKRKLKLQGAQMTIVKDIVASLTKNVQEWPALDDSSTIEATSLPPEAWTPQRRRVNKGTTISVNRETSPIFETSTIDSGPEPQEASMEPYTVDYPLRPSIKVPCADQMEKEQDVSGLTHDTPEKVKTRRNSLRRVANRIQVTSDEGSNDVSFEMEIVKPCQGSTESAGSHETETTKAFDDESQISQAEGIY